MNDEQQLAAWENEGGAANAEPDRTCRVCGGCGGGSEPHLVCRACDGTGEERFTLEEDAEFNRLDEKFQRRLAEDGGRWPEHTGDGK